MKKTFKFKVGEDTRSRVSKVGRTDSTFFEAYNQAYEVLNEICKNTKSYINDADRQYDELYNYYNNIIIFSAQRGCGKTSAMLTFTHSLVNDIKNTETYDGMNRPSGNYIVLPPIDPTTLDKKHDILSIILSRLFNYASRKWTEIGKTSSLAKKEAVIKYLGECYRGVSSLSSETGNRNWTLDELSNLSDSSFLKQSMHKLAESIIELNDQKPEDTHIVIQIDDADMNFDCMYDILERIRSYMTIPNVVILFAADINLLWRLMYKKFLSTLNREKSLEQKLEADRQNAAQLAEQYLMKCFPMAHRIYLKSLGEIIQTKQYDLCIEEEEPKETILDDKYQDKNLQGFPLEYSLLRYLFRRTGIWFCEHSGFHYILPQTQRGMVQFLSMLARMKQVPHLDQLDSYEKGDKTGYSQENLLYYMDTEENRDSQYETWISNVNLLFEYFMNNWLEANLSAESQDILRKLDETRLIEKNKYIISVIKSETGKEYDKIGVDSYYIVCDLLAQYKGSANEQFAFAVRTYYALLSQRLILNHLRQYYKKIQSDVQKGVQIDVQNNVQNDVQKEAKRRLCSFKDLVYLYRSNFPSEFGMNAVRQVVVIDKNNQDHPLTMNWNAKPDAINDAPGTDEYKENAEIVSKLFSCGTIKKEFNLFSPIYNCILDDTTKVDNCNELFICALKQFQDVCLSIFGSLDSQMKLTRLCASKEKIKMRQNQEVSKWELIRAAYKKIRECTWFINEKENNEKEDNERTAAWLDMGYADQSNTLGNIRECIKAFYGTISRKPKTGEAKRTAKKENSTSNKGQESATDSQESKPGDGKEGNSDPSKGRKSATTPKKSKPAGAKRAPKKDNPTPNEGQESATDQPVTGESKL